MNIKDKYNIPPSTWQAMARDGIITSKVDRAECILSCYSKKKALGLDHTEAVKSTAEEMRVSSTWVYVLVRKFN
jgi:hypothetical protein